MKSIARLVLPLAFTSLTSVAFGGLDEVEIRGISYGGNGCPQGSVGDLLASDKKSFTLLFDEYIAEAGPGISRREARKFCQISLELHVPQGWQYSVAEFTYRGFVDVERNMTGQQKSTYYFDSAREGTFTSNFRGPYTNDYKFTDRLGIESLVWSRCGETKLLNIKTEVSLSSRDRNAYGLITTDSIDGSVVQKYGLQWRQCR